MKAIDYLFDFFNSISDFWNGFLEGFFEGDSAFIDYSEPKYSFLPPGLKRLQDLRARRNINRTPDWNPPPKFPGFPFPNHDYTSSGFGSKTTPDTKPANPSNVVALPVPQKMYRPDIEYLYHCTLDVEFLFPEPRFITLRFDVLIQPYIDRKLDERLYSYTFVDRKRPFRFYFSRGSAMPLYHGTPLPGHTFILKSISETVEVTENKEPVFILVYTIQDCRRKKRKFKAAKPLKDGILEALTFFFRLQYYDNWEDYDEMHELCPTLLLSTRDIHNQLRRDLCEAGMKLRPFPDS